VRAHVAVAVLLALAAVGCARKHVRDPEAAMRSHDLDWTVTTEPAQPAAPPAEVEP
jgi:hypothetical protein